VLFGSASSATSSACSYMYGAQMLCSSNILIFFRLMCFRQFNFDEDLWDFMTMSICSLAVLLKLVQDYACYAERTEMG
jgi:hypothetical protein